MTTPPDLSLAPAPAATARGRICPRCSYERRLADTAPAWQCPRCQVAYEKASAPSPASVRRQAAREQPEGKASTGRMVGIALLLLLAGAAWWGVAAWRAAHPSAAERAARAAAAQRQGEVHKAVQAQQVDAELAQAEEHLRMARTEAALEILERHVALGNPRAMVALGIVHRDGYRVKQDLPRAMELFTRAAAEGRGAAFAQLGHASETGQGRPQSMDEAINQYGKAARQGHASSLYRLGAIYAKGVPGVPPEAFKAHVLLDLAQRAQKANPAQEEQLPGRGAFWADSELRALEATMSPVDVVRAREWADAWQPGQPLPP